MTTGCEHNSVDCLNQFELIRKYQCKRCGEVMMCACDKAVGEKFLPHQLSQGTRLETQEQVPVTLGFEENVCELCRTGNACPHPVASIHGRTSKIKRYYWRELAFRTMEIFEELGGSGDEYLLEIGEQSSERYQQAEKQALAEIKQMHHEAPRYVYSEESTASFLRRFCVPIREISAKYVSSPEKKVLIKHGGQIMHVEAFAERFYKELGYSVQRLESVPLHALFGVYCWILIQDPSDPLGRVVQFGARDAYDRDRSKKPISTILPEDFGTPGYAARRGAAIAEHVSHLEDGGDDLEWLFDYWVQPSERLRQYLWAHRREDVESARRLVTTLPSSKIINIIRYLIESYWARYLGWPDFLATRGDETLFIEVKSSKDRVSGDQKSWIEGNFENLKLPFEILKVHRADAQQIIAADI